MGVLKAGQPLGFKQPLFFSKSSCPRLCPLLVSSCHAPLYSSLWREPSSWEEQPFQGGWGMAWFLPPSVTQRCKLLGCPWKELKAGGKGVDVRMGKRRERLQVTCVLFVFLGTSSSAPSRLCLKNQPPPPTPPKAASPPPSRPLSPPWPLALR